MSWLESHQSLGDHPKKDRLAELLFEGSVPLDVADFAAVGLLHRLWWWAIDYAPKGDLSIYTDRQVAKGCRWAGEAGLLLQALTRAGFLDKDRQIHDWHDYAGKLIESRAADVKRKHRIRGVSGGVSAGHSAHRPADTPRSGGRTYLPTDLPTDQPGVPSEPSSAPAAPKVKAPTDADWQRRADDLLARSAFPTELQRLMELMADANKTGKVSLARVVRELLEPLVELEAQFPAEAMRHGLRAAISAGAANKTYVRKAAAGYRGAGPSGSGYRPGSLSAGEVLERYGVTAGVSAGEVLDGECVEETP